MKILVINIGGTGVKSMVFTSSQGGADLEASTLLEEFSTQETGSFLAIMQKAISELGLDIKSIDRVVVASTGDFDSDKDKIRNSGTFSGGDLNIGEAREHYSLGANLIILNDLEGEVPYVATSRFAETSQLEIHPGSEDIRGRGIALYMAPGTFFGGAGLRFDDSRGIRERIIRMEPGNKSLGMPVSESILNRWTDFGKFLKRTVEPRVAWNRAETIVSGPGLERIYEFLSGQKETAANIGAAIEADEINPPEVKEWWTECLALLVQATLYDHWEDCSEIILSGGVLRKTPKLLTSPRFREVLFGEYSSYEPEHIKKRRITLVTDDQSVVWGPAYYAACL